MSIINKLTLPFISKQKKLNEVIFGPLLIKGSFSYILDNVCEINIELLKYIHHIDSKNNQKTKIINLIENAIFTRVVRLDLGYTSPIIGLITVKIFNKSYNISHISIHEEFRCQGLAKLLILLFANYLYNEEKPELLQPLITCIIPNNIDDLVSLFRSLKFNEMNIDTEYHMLKSTKIFTKLIESPI